MLLDILWPLEEWRFLLRRDSYQTTTKHAMHKWHWVMSLDKVARGNGIDLRMISYNFCISIQIPKVQSIPL